MRRVAGNLRGGLLVRVPGDQIAPIGKGVKAPRLQRIDLETMPGQFQVSNDFSCSR